MSDTSSAEVSTLHDYLSVFRRHTWVILGSAVIVPLLALVYVLSQEPLYRGSADVLLSRQNLAASLTGTPDPSFNLQPDRLVKTQADLASSPTVAKRVLKTQELEDRTAQEFLDASEVTTKGDTDLLRFAVSDRSKALASRLATEYARQFTIYRRELDTAALERARQGLGVRIRELRRSGDRGSSLYASLVEKQEQLRTMEALQTGNTVIVRAAANAVQVQPRPVRDVLLGLGIGLILGVVIAFLMDALDTRLRSAEEIGAALKLPLLARLPEPPRQLRSEGLVMISERSGIEAEAFRMLKTNFEFVNLERAARTVMITSAVEQEGKSTTIANLAVALALAGRRVALVDLDLRRPVLDRFFGIEEGPGFTGVALGHASLGEALVPIVLTDPAQNGTTPAYPSGNGDNVSNGNGDHAATTATIGRKTRQAPAKTSIARGLLEVLPAGALPPDVGEFVDTHALAGVLTTLNLSGRFDLVLIDAPPVLHVGDAMALSDKVDALLVVCRLNVVSRQMVGELHRVLDACPAPKLGFILTGAEIGDGYGSGSYYYAGRADVGSKTAVPA